MAEPNVEVFVCVNVDCKSRGAQGTLTRLRQRLEERGLAHIKPESIICFAACNVGPNVVIPSKRCWLSGVTQEQVDTVVDLLEGKPVDIAALQAGNDPQLDQMIFQMIDAGLLDKGDST